jgi:hypothetical protein
MAKNIHNAAGVSVHDYDYDETISSISDILVIALSSLSLDKQLEGYQKLH